MNSIPSKQELLETKSRIEQDVHRTPVITCEAINEWSGANVFLKCENLQKVGAFKARGGINAVRMFCSCLIKLCFERPAGQKETAFWLCCNAKLR